MSLKSVFLSILLTVYELRTINGQTRVPPCTRGNGQPQNLTILASVQESSSGAIVDTTINGILNGVTDSGVTLTIQQTNNFNAQEYFTVESRTLNSSEFGYSERSFLVLNQPLDRDGPSPETNDDLNVVEFLLICRGGVNGEIVTTVYTVRINVVDINDNSPTFIGAPYNTAISELMPIGTTIYQNISATDLDSGSNGVIRFEITAGSPSEATNLFSISSLTGHITVKNHLDFERLNSRNISGYNLVVSAYDIPSNRSLSRTSTTGVFISILDADDLGPVFEDQYCVKSGKGCFNPYYLTEISDQSFGPLMLRSAQNPSTIVNMQVRDQDTLNSPISLTIIETIPSGYEDHFILERVTLQASLSFTVIQQQPVESKSVNSIKIIIKATEMTPNKYSDRAIVEASYERKLNSSCPPIQNEPCPSVTPIVAGILGSLLFIVLIILIGVLVFIRRQQHSESVVAKRHHKEYYSLDV